MNAQRRKRIDAVVLLFEKIGQLMVEAQAEVEAVAAEELAAFEALPEGIQSSERGQEIEECASMLDEIANDIEAFDLDYFINSLNEASRRS